MKSHAFLLALAAAVAVTAVVPAQAAPADAAAARWERLLKRADANSDGVLSRAEVRGLAGRTAKRLDANKDGIVTRAEFTAVNAKAKGDRQALAAARGKAFDRATGGKADQIARADLVAQGIRRVMRADSDRNGTVTREEFLARATAAATGKKG